MGGAGSSRASGLEAARSTVTTFRVATGELGCLGMNVGNASGSVSGGSCMRAPKRMEP